MKHVLVTLCAALVLGVAACGGGGDGGNNTDVSGDVGTPAGDDNTPTPTPDPNPTPNPGDSFSVCDPCTVDTLSTGFGECLDACRVDCPEQFSECRDACLDECDGCGTGLSCLYSSATRAYRCGPTHEVTTCDGVDYGGSN